MMRKTFPVLFIMTILIATTATISIDVPFAEALKSKGKDTPGRVGVNSYGSANNKIVCGDRLCSEVKSPNDVSSENHDDKMNDAMMEKKAMMDKEKSMMMDKKSTMMDKMIDEKSMMMDKEKSMMMDKMMDKEKSMMMDKMMEIHSTVNGDLTAPAGDAPFGGNAVGDFSIIVTKNDALSITAIIEHDSSKTVLEGWLVDIDSDYKLSLGKADQKGQLMFEQTLVNPWIYDVLVITEEPIGDHDPSPNKPLGASLLSEPFGL